MSQSPEYNQDRDFDALIRGALQSMTPPVDAGQAKREFVRRAQQRFSAPEEPHPWSVSIGRRWRLAGAGLAYAACLAVMLGYFAWQNPIDARVESASPPGLIQSTVEAIRIGAGSNARFHAGDVLRLRDGTQVECLAPTTLSLRYDADARRILLHDGALEILAAEHPSAPFRVETSDARVTVTGTRFIVSTRSMQ
jgi:ferric-dicitrate binding protein FerR (iron transport regulator)